MAYGSGSTYRSPRGRVSSFHGRGRGAISDSYQSSSRDSYSSKPRFRGYAQNTSYRGRNDNCDLRGRGTYRCNGGRDSYAGESNSYSGDHVIYSASFSRRDEESSFHRRETRESSSGSYGRENSRRSDGESNRKRGRVLAGSYNEGYSPRRSYERDHQNRSLNSSSSSLCNSNSGSYGDKSYQKDFNDFKTPLPLSERFTYNSRRPERGTRGRISTTTRSTASLSSKIPTSRFKPTSRLQLTLRKKKQLQIMRMRKEREARVQSSSFEKHLEENERSSRVEEESQVIENVDMEENPNLDDAPPGVSSPVRAPTNRNFGASPRKFKSLSESPQFREKRLSSLRRIPLKCPHCKLECEMFRTYQEHLSSPKHQAAMEELLLDLKQKLKKLRTDQREAQRVIDERDDNRHNRHQTSYCKLCKLNYKQSRRDHFASDFHVSTLEFLNSRCKICRMNFATPLLYEHHRCSITHIKKKAFLERISASNVGNQDEENEDENFMVLDSVGSADESNEDVDYSMENIALVEAKMKTTIIGREFIEKVDVYYCELCKLCLHFNPNRDAENELLMHCRSRFHLKRFSLQEAKKNKSEKLTRSSKEPSTPVKSADNPSAEAMNDSDEIKQCSDDKVTGDDYKLSGDENDSLLKNTSRYDRFSASDENITDKIKVEPVDKALPMEVIDIKQDVVVKDEPE